MDRSPERRTEEDGEAETPARPAWGWVRAFNSLSIPQFRTLWIGMLIAMSAVQVSMVAQPWLAYAISGSGLALGVVAVARGLPMLVLAPIAGAVADRLDKRNLLIAAHGCFCAVTLATTVLVFLGVVQVWHLVVLASIEGVAFPFSMPVRQAYVSQLVPSHRLANALAVDGAGMNLTRVLAPSVAGALLAWEPTAAFAASAALHLVAASLLLLLPRSRKAMGRRAGTLGDVMVGVRYLRSQPVLMALLGMAFVAVLLGMPYHQFLPVFQQDVLSVGPSQLGLMFTAVGAGALVGSLVTAFLSEYPRRGLIQIVSGVAFGVSLALFALSPVYGLSLALLAVVGFTSQGYMTMNRVLIMTNTDAAYQGRVTSVYFMTFALMPASVLPMGALVDIIGAPATLAGAGALLAVFIAAVAVLHPASWRRTAAVAASGAD